MRVTRRPSMTGCGFTQMEPQSLQKTKCGKIQTCVLDDFMELLSFQKKVTHATVMTTGTQSPRSLRGVLSAHALPAAMGSRRSDGASLATARPSRATRTSIRLACRQRESVVAQMAMRPPVTAVEARDGLERRVVNVSARDHCRLICARRYGCFAQFGPKSRLFLMAHCMP